MCPEKSIPQVISPSKFCVSALLRDKRGAKGVREETGANDILVKLKNNKWAPEGVVRGGNISAGH